MKTHELYAYLCVTDAARAIDFYGKAFGATEVMRLVEPGGRIGHAEIDLDGHLMMLAEEFPGYGFQSPEKYGGSPVAIHLHVDNADDVIQRAVGAGAVVVREVQDQFYGERSGSIRDPFGHQWLIGHHIEDVTPAEMQRRYTQMMSGGNT